MVPVLPPWVPAAPVGPISADPDPAPPPGLYTQPFPNPEKMAASRFFAAERPDYVFLGLPSGRDSRQLHLARRFPP